MENLKEKQKLYIGCKIIKAEQMDECTFLEQFKNEDVSNRETRPGYLVIYPDGYKSWSPSEVFETAYREVVRGEVELFRETDCPKCGSDRWIKEGEYCECTECMTLFKQTVL